MDYFTADSYKTAEYIGEPFDKKGKLYTKAKIKCDRCTNGIYAVGVENGQIKPHPAYGGICLKCHGAGFLIKEIRLYTEKEYNQMKKSAEKAKEKREAKREADMKANYATKKAEWLEKNGFNEEGFTYIYIKESYSIKDKLKADGFKYDTVLKWHRASNEGYETDVIKLNVNDCFEFSAWGEGHYKTEAKGIIEEMIAGTQPRETSDWISAPGERIKDYPVTIVNKGGFTGKYGYSNIYHFRDENNNLLVWFTTVELKQNVGDKIKITAVVKSHDTYKGTKQTIITRCKVK